MASTMRFLSNCFFFAPQLLPLAAFSMACARSIDPTLETTGLNPDSNIPSNTGGDDDRVTSNSSSKCGVDCANIVDSAPCFRSVCDEELGRCIEVSDDGQVCDDGLFCTEADTCLDGICTGSTERSCATSTTSACAVGTCDEITNACVTEWHFSGEPCSTDNLCMTQGTCSSEGECLEILKDCTFSITNNDCNEGVCNPLSGQCEASPIADGAACSDATISPCLVNTTCAAGVCGGGTMKDCSHLNHGCMEGLCDPSNGTCTASPLLNGDPCPEATNQCNAGLCSASGSCDPEPVSDGTPCKRICFTGSNCQSGKCSGGVEDIDCDTFKQTLELGFLHSCAIKKDGTLWCWGFNYHGELGLGDSGTGSERSNPTQVGTDSQWATISAGSSHTCASKLDGSLWCWGSNEYGELGLGDSGFGTERLMPTQVGTSTTWATVRTGSYHSCGVKTDGTLWCWGYNGSGELGLGDSGDGTERIAPAQVGTNTDWATTALGESDSCAIKQDGTLWCWGENGHGQLGLGDSGQQTSRAQPTQVGSNSDWANISLGNTHSCALRADGSLWCWGYNSDGQLGLGYSGIGTHRESPTRVGTSSEWVGVQLGNGHSCSTRSDGTLWCWGSNGSGQLGLGDAGVGTQRTSPNLVTALTDIAMHAAGSQHGCSIRIDGTLWCWGSNFGGGLGIGTKIDTSSPSQAGIATDWN